MFSLVTQELSYCLAGLLINYETPKSPAGKGLTS